MPILKGKMSENWVIIGAKRRKFAIFDVFQVKFQLRKGVPL